MLIYMDQKDFEPSRRRRARLLKNLAEATAEDKELVRRGASEGCTEVDMAHWLGVTRMTIRDWLGKKR
jgi:hypothetical protein